MTAKRGFTLIELLVVIAIIGILASVVLASLNSARQKGRDAKRVSDIKQLQLALELYYDANSNYPTGSGTPTAVLTTPLTSNGYISVIPVDPTNSGSYVYGYYSLNADNSACTTGPCAKYVLSSQLETSNSALSSGITTNFTGGPNCSVALMFCVTP